MRKVVSYIVAYGRAILFALLLAVVGTLIAPGLGTVIGFFIGLVLGGAAAQEKLNPEQYKMHHGTCPHCGSPVKWRIAYVNKSGFNCPTCKGRIVLVDNAPHTPAQAKELQAH